MVLKNKLHQKAQYVIWLVATTRTIVITLETSAHTKHDIKTVNSNTTRQLRRSLVARLSTSGCGAS